MKNKIHIGTSGWSYAHWKENFYPEKMPANQWLNFYGETFSTVEINTTFYHIPSESTVERWYQVVPENFLFSVKASRYITHIKRLKDCKDSVKLFFSSIKKLQTKVGPILFQLPPSFKMDKERLENFIGLLNDKYIYTFEFRHESWYVNEIYDLLNKNKIALCITDLGGKLSPMEVTSNFTYLRLHGPQKAYQGSYGLPKLRLWKKRMNEWIDKKKSVYCYFDNDEKGFAIEDARTLQNLLTK